LAQPNPTWQVMGTRPTQLGSPATVRNYANSTLLPTGQIMVSGGVGPSQHDADAVKTPEIYDPATNAWLATSPATVPRNYHGVAMLLPDGRVWTASGSKDHSGSQCGGGSSCNVSGPDESETRVEIFTPWYYGRSDRPAVTSCPDIMVANGTQYGVQI